MAQVHANALPVPPQAASDADLLTIQQQGLKRFYLTLPSFAVVLTLLWVGVFLGTVKPGAAQIITLAASIALAPIYGLLRSGRVVRSADPMLAFSQALFSIGLVSVSYALLDDLRSTALLWMSVIVVFDMWRLPRWQVRVAMVCCVVMPLLATAARHWLYPTKVDWLQEVFTLLMLAVVLPVLFAISRQARAVHARHLQQKLSMSTTLAQMQAFSIRDGLTGLFDRRYTMSLLENEVQRWQRTKQPFSVAILDLDHFKRVNDQFGHGVGDIVLQTFSRLAQATFPQQADVLGRWGGEEFLLLQIGAKQDDMMAALTALREVVAAHNWGQYAEGLHVSFSAGACQHQEGQSLPQTLEFADQALYKAKAAGRDRAIGYAASQAAASPSQGNQFANAYAKVVTSSLPVASQRRTMPTLSDFTSDALPPDEPKPNVWLERVLALLYGRHLKLRTAQYLCTLAFIVYVASIVGFEMYVVPMGYLSRGQANYFIAHNIIGAVLPYLLLRFGLTLKWADPSFVLPQILWGGTGVIIGYAMMPTTSPATLQMICLSLVFGFSSLHPRETLFVGRYYLVLMFGALAARTFLEPAGFSPRREVIEVGMTCMALWMLTLQSHKLSLHRETVRHEKRELAAATDKVNRIMRHDPLTGLFNRQHMQSLLERECARHARTGGSFSVALIDLDHFKSVNDQHGHPVGDEVLKSFAKVAMGRLRDTDVLCRWGGEEFLVLLVGADPGAHGLQAANRLREALLKVRVSTAVPDLRVSFSAGVSEHLSGEPIVKTLQRADEALYEAKAQGRNRCVVSPLPVVGAAVQASSSDSALRSEAAQSQ
jgi:diguanylate cyclase (GGDEF)-like protein